MHSLNTIKGKILIAFTFLTLIIIFLSGSTLWYIKKGQEIHYKKDLVSLVYNKSLRLFKIDQTIPHNVNPKSDQSISTESLKEKRRQLIAEINKSLDQLKIKDDELSLYENIVNLNTLLAQYELNVENEIPEETEGSTKEPYILQEAIEAEYEKILLKIQTKHEFSRRDEKLIYSISVIYSILLSVFLSLFTASKISKPFKVLAEMMDASHDFQVNRKTIRQLDQSSNEVKALFTSFENLLDEISCQLEIIKEKSEILEHQNQKLQISEKNLNESNNVKDKFFSILAHDLRSPFATIQSFLDVLINHSEAFTKEEIMKLANEMSVTMEGLMVLLENLLEWSRSQMGYIEYSPSSINISEIVEKNIKIINIRASNKNITIKAVYLKTLYAYADYNMVDFILRNLLSNAVKFSSVNGKIFVECSEHKDFIEISIIDNGIGLSEEDQNKLFKKDISFSKVGTSQERGTGLGLLLCKEFIEKCFGNIAVQSKKGKGATFKFTLPILHVENKKKVD